MDEEIVFCTGGGCTAKLGPAVLERVLGKLPKPEQKDPNLLIGYDSSDDAAVYKLTDDLAVVQTLDFFPPMIEDPYLFGQVAAANALSDIYAMGGDVKTALNIVCFPETMDLNILGKILQGGNEKVLEAGGVLAGGHSIQDTGVKYGLSVTGTIHPDHIFPNNGCREGDVLLLTKPLGVGILCTAGRMGEASPYEMDEAIHSMTQLNKTASEQIRRFRVHGCTDVTGFGLLGHLKEMLGNTYSAHLFGSRIPIFSSALSYAEDFYLTAAGQRNRNHVGNLVRFEGISFGMEEVLFDPQTSGGLLISLPAEDAKEAEKQLQASGLSCARIGEIFREKTQNILVTA